METTSFLNSIHLLSSPSYRVSQYCNNFYRDSLKASPFPRRPRRLRTRRNESSRHWFLCKTLYRSAKHFMTSPTSLLTTLEKGTRMVVSQSRTFVSPVTGYLGSGRSEWTHRQYFFKVPSSQGSGSYFFYSVCRNIDVTSSFLPGLLRGRTG